MSTKRTNKATSVAVIETDHGTVKLSGAIADTMKNTDGRTKEGKRAKVLTRLISDMAHELNAYGVSVRQMTID